MTSSLIIMINFSECRFLSSGLTTWRNNTEGSHLHTRRREDLKSHNFSEYVSKQANIHLCKLFLMFSEESQTISSCTFFFSENLKFIKKIVMLSCRVIVKIFRFNNSSNGSTIFCKTLQ
jgi:hypothetical protein